MSDDVIGVWVGKGKFGDLETGQPVIEGMFDPKTIKLQKKLGNIVEERVKGAVKESIVKADAEVVKLKKEIEGLEKQVKSLTKKNDKLKKSEDSLKSEIEDLKKPEGKGKK